MRCLGLGWAMMWQLQALVEVAAVESEWRQQHTSTPTHPHPPTHLHTYTQKTWSCDTVSDVKCGLTQSPQLCH